MNTIKTKSLLCLLVTMFAFSLEARETTTRKNLSLATAEHEIGHIKADSVEVGDVTEFVENVVTMKGYSKLAGASKESFMLVNNSNLHLYGMEIKFKYVDLDGVLIHERVENVMCDLPPFASKQVSIKSFDEGHRFYYYRSKSKKDAVAYDLTIRIESYNIKVTRN